MPLKTMLYLPLDERPCNWLFPQMMTRGVAELELLTPPKELLGRKKTPADLEGLWGCLGGEFLRPGGGEKYTPPKHPPPHKTPGGLWGPRRPNAGG